MGGVATLLQECDETPVAVREWSFLGGSGPEGPEHRHCYKSVMRLL